MRKQREVHQAIVPASESFTPAAGQTVEATINGHLCGQGVTWAIGDEIVYVIDVRASDDTVQSSNCGDRGEMVSFAIDRVALATKGSWDNTRVRLLTLATDVVNQRMFLPIVSR